MKEAARAWALISRESGVATCPAPCCRMRGGREGSQRIRMDPDSKSLVKQGRTGQGHCSLLL